MTNIRTILYIGVLALSTMAIAQTQRLLISRGNEHYKAGRYADATVQYQRALDTEGTYRAYAYFGLGNSLYAQQKYEQAAQAYEAISSDESLSPEQRAAVYHNLGNIAMQSKAYDKAVEAYKQSLICNPDDDDTRYNLVLAQKQLKKNNQSQQGGQGEQNQQQNDQQEQQPQQSPSDGDKKPSEDKPGPKDAKQKENPDTRGQGQDPKDGKMSREQADQLLDRYKQSDEETRRKVERLERQNQEYQQQQNKRKW